MSETRKPEPTPYEKSVGATKRVLSVSKEELDKRAWRKRREKKRREK